jgi:hypothetical protein
MWGWNIIIQEESKATICFEEYCWLVLWLVLLALFLACLLAVLSLSRNFQAIMHVSVLWPERPEGVRNSAADANMYELASN